MNSLIKAFLHLLLAVIFYCLSITVSAQTVATFEIGEATTAGYDISDTEVTPFTTIEFDRTFADAPNVFIITHQFAGDPCIIRITNVTATSFDATCLEPFDATREDGDNPGAAFTYLAIADGGVSVPISPAPTDPAAPTEVVFQSACQNVSNQQWGNSCPGCAGTESLAAITFGSAFNAAPAVLAQIQTTNNDNEATGVPSGEPAFIGTVLSNDTATSITTSGFNVAIERMEASQVAFLSEPENICYLAVEQTGCESLDFSSLGGPTTPVMFQALTGLRNIEGQNTSGSTTNFETDCFDSTPIALATHISRGGSDGTFLRLIDVTDTGITLIADEDTVGDSERNHPGDEQPAIFAFSEAFTTPVTLNSAKVSLIGRLAKFSWETTAESFHLGFNLWGETADGWVQLNNRLIKGSDSDTDTPQTYHQTRRLTRAQRNEITNFGLSSVDLTGYEEFYGPFSEGQEYGEAAITEPIDWSVARTSFEQSMRTRGFTKVNNRWRRLSTRTKSFIEKRNLGIERTSFNLNVESSGIHSISAGELIALNPSWNGIRLSRIALTLNGNALPRHIISDDNHLDTDDRIVFNAINVVGQDTPFIENYTYRLSIDYSKSVDATAYDGSTASDQELTSDVLIPHTLTSKRQHSAALATGDPWYDARLLSVGNPASSEYKIDFQYPINTEKEGLLDIVLFGGLNFPGDDDDHHVQIYVNESLVQDSRFDGLHSYKQRLTLPAGLLKNAGNSVRVTVVGDTGFFGDVVLVDDITLSSYSVLSETESPSLSFLHDNKVEAYRIPANNSADAEVYAYTESGLLSAVFTTKHDDSIEFTQLPFEASDNARAELRYALGQASTWPTPSISISVGDDLHSQEADYLIVAHPSFIGEELDQFVKFKTELGYTVRVLDWLDIVNTYGYGNNTPAALNKFLATANQHYRTDNILIVGGHTFDYFGITDENLVNFIPSHYRPVSVFEYTATDNPYADLNGDNIPDVAIGRWPVRSITDLQTIIAKTIDWHNNREDSQYQDAYLVAQARDGQGLDFGKQLDIRVNFPMLELSEIDSVNTLYLDELPDSVTDVVSYTRTELAEKINNGTDLISFSGHASPSSWGGQNIINTEFINNLSNQGQPILLMPLACYITHFESVSTNTLAHQWLFAGEQGAAAIHGASVLGDYRENGVFAQRYLIEAKTAKTVGQAILNAKRKLGANNEILHNWTMLGDPALPIR